MGLFDIFKKKREVYINPELPFENKLEGDKTYEEIMAGVVAGDSESLFTMGCCYVSGSVVKQDLSKAVEYFKKAAEKGHALAQCELGVCYCNGEGVEADVEEGVRWFEESASQGYAKAWNELCVSYNRCGVGCESRSDFNHILNSLKRAGYMPAYRTQARGEYIRGNYAKVRKLYEQLVKMGDAEAACQLGVQYFHGDYGRSKKHKAIDWYMKAVKMGSVHACNDLAVMILLILDDVKTAQEQFLAMMYSLFERGAEMGDVNAMVHLGQLCQSGIMRVCGDGFIIQRICPREQGVEIAKKWWQKAVELGDTEAAKFLEGLNEDEFYCCELRTQAVIQKFGDQG